MFRLLILFFTLALSLYALSDAKVLSRAEKLLGSKSQSDNFRAYNDYKNIYLRSLMSGDIELKIRALKGVVKSGKKLHIDVSKYEKELKKYKKVSAQKKKTIYKKPTHRSTKEKKKKKIKLQSSHKLKSVKWINSELVLEFDKKLRSNQINYFKLYDKNKKVYKYIFDIHASMITKSKTLNKAGIKRIKLGQVNSNTIRLVIENDTKVKVRFVKKPKSIKIRIKPTVCKKEVCKKPLPPVRLDRDKTIVIDAGHGGKDPGAIGYRGYKEKTVVLKIALELRDFLRMRGYRVYMTRTKDKFVKLSKRTKYANKKKADIFISIHANAVGKDIALKASGIETYFLSPSRSERAKRVAAKENVADLKEMDTYGKNSFLNLLNHRNILASNKLAIDLQRGMLGSLNTKYKGVKDGGVREGPFWVLVGAQMPSVLIEVGFMTHLKEATRLASSKYRKLMAKGMADGIERYFMNNN